MILSELLEQDKEQLLSSMKDKQTTAEAAEVLQKEADRLLFKYNQEEHGERTRQAASDLLQTVRMSTLLSDSASEARIWEHAPVAKQNTMRFSLLTWILLAAGAVLVLAAVIAAAPNRSFGSAALSILGGAAGGGLLFFAGTRAGGGSVPKGKAEQYTEILPDPARLYRGFRNVITLVDQTLERIDSEEKWEQKKTAEASAKADLPQDELQLLSGLLEAACSEDSAFAGEKLSDIRYYLHCHQIETVFYDEETARWFDVMPSREARTIRPALVTDGRLLQKGVAAGGM